MQSYFICSIRVFKLDFCSYIPLANITAVIAHRAVVGNFLIESIHMNFICISKDFVSH